MEPIEVNGIFYYGGNPDGRPRCPLCKVSLFNIGSISSHLKTQHGKGGASSKLPPAVRAEKKRQTIKEGSKRLTLQRRLKREEERKLRTAREKETCETLSLRRPVKGTDFYVDEFHHHHHPAPGICTIRTDRSSRPTKT